MKRLKVAGLKCVVNITLCAPGNQNICVTRFIAKFALLQHLPGLPVDGFMGWLDKAQEICELVEILEENIQTEVQREKSVKTEKECQVTQ